MEEIRLGHCEQAGGSERGRGSEPGIAVARTQGEGGGGKGECEKPPVNALGDVERAGHRRHRGEDDG